MTGEPVAFPVESHAHFESLRIRIPELKQIDVILLVLVGFFLNFIVLLRSKRIKNSLKFGKIRPWLRLTIRLRFRQILGFGLGVDLRLGLGLRLVLVLDVGLGLGFGLCLRLDLAEQDFSILVKCSLKRELRPMNNLLRPLLIQSDEVGGDRRR